VLYDRDALVIHIDPTQASRRQWGFYPESADSTYKTDNAAKDARISRPSRVIVY